MISRLVDRDLGEEQQKIVHAHLSECVACRKLFSDYTKTMALLRESNTIQANSTHHYPQPAQRPTILSWNPVWAMRIAALFVIGIAIIAVYIVSNSQKTNLSPTLVGMESRQTMNVPMGSLAYYEQQAGMLVQSQYVSLSQAAESLYEIQSDTIASHYMSYESPLFLDNSVTESRIDAFIAYY